jgi:hypothetical protein
MVLVFFVYRSVVPIGLEEKRGLWQLYAVSCIAVFVLVDIAYGIAHHTFSVNFCPCCKDFLNPITPF